MVDVTATEVGVKKTTVNLVDGVYVINRNVSGYKVQLNAEPSPFPVPVPALQITSVTPPDPDDAYAGAFILNGTGFDLVDPVFAFLYVVGPDTSLPIPETMVGFVPISATQWGTQADIVTIILNSYAVAPYGFRFKLVPGPGSGLPTVYSPVIPVVPAVPVLSVTFAVPSSVDETQDPGITLYGSGFNIAIVDAVVAFIPALASVPVSTFTVDSDTQITIPPGTGFLPALLAMPGVTAPFQMQFQVNQGPVYAQGAPVDVTAVVVPDPMSDAYFTAYTGDPGEAPLTVTGGPGPSLYVLRTYPSLPSAVAFDMSTLPLGPAVNSWTLCGWFRRQDFDGGFGQFADVQINPACVVSFYNGSLENVRVSIGTTNLIETMPLSYPQDDRNWHHVAIVRDAIANEFRLYYEGSFIASIPIGPGNSTLYNAGGNFTFGKAALPPDTVCEGTPAVWLRALTDTDIAAVYTNTTFPP
jgi:hypothetical protein